MLGLLGLLDPLSLLDLLGLTNLLSGLSRLGLPPLLRLRRTLRGALVGIGTCSLQNGIGLMVGARDNRA